MTSVNAVPNWTIYCRWRDKREEADENLLTRLLCTKTGNMRMCIFAGQSKWINDFNDEALNFFTENVQDHNFPQVTSNKNIPRCLPSFLKPAYVPTLPTATTQNTDRNKSVPIKWLRSISGHTFAPLCPRFSWTISNPNFWPLSSKDPAEARVN